VLGSDCYGVVMGGIIVERENELMANVKRIGDVFIPFRIGFGEDSHHIRRVSDREVITFTNEFLHLGGVMVDKYVSPDSNSDGDAIIHATFNAISSAFGLNPVGYYFKGKMNSSQPILNTAVDILNESPYIMMNMVISIEAKEPKIIPLIPLIQKNLSSTFSSDEYKVNPDQIGITVTSGEGLSKYGLGEGIHVTVTVMLIDEVFKELFNLLESNFQFIEKFLS